MAKLIFSIECSNNNRSNRLHCITILVNKRPKSNIDYYVFRRFYLDCIRSLNVASRLNVLPVLLHWTHWWIAYFPNDINALLIRYNILHSEPRESSTPFLNGFLSCAVNTLEREKYIFFFRRYCYERSYEFISGLAFLSGLGLILNNDFIVFIYHFSFSTFWDLFTE